MGEAGVEVGDPTAVVLRVEDLQVDPARRHASVVGRASPHLDRLQELRPKSGEGSLSQFGIVKS